MKDGYVIIPEAFLEGFVELRKAMIMAMKQSKPYLGLDDDRLLELRTKVNKTIGKVTPLELLALSSFWFTDAVEMMVGEERKDML